MESNLLDPGLIFLGIWGQNDPNSNSKFTLILNPEPNHFHIPYKTQFLISSVSSLQRFSFSSSEKKMATCMLRSALKRVSSSSSTYLVRRSFASESSSPERKVAVLGAAGGIGQPLALLMKLNIHLFQNLLFMILLQLLVLLLMLAILIPDLRAKTFYAGKAKVPPAEVNVPVVGGHAGITILPLFSQATPKANLADEDIKALTKRTQDGGTEVVEAKAGKG
ncbi:Malate dehydrogenase protein [Thalictrum thalictroides]|uniref:Malate dehydrogenase protein n=1 Tax=Thalictrum thalictroides TaxID=46969 RepID=A0A7J6V6Z6_THATH|nr:Malate dehydrogenase protein [Thalictrum thalictroides]